MTKIKSSTLVCLFVVCAWVFVGLGNGHAYQNTMGLTKAAIQNLKKMIASSVDKDSTENYRIAQLLNLFESDHLNDALLDIDKVLMTDMPLQKSFALMLLKARIYYRKGLLKESVQQYEELFDLSQKKSIDLVS